MFSLGQTRRYSDLEQRALTAAAASRAFADPDLRRRCGEAVRLAHQDRDTKIRHCASMKRRAAGRGAPHSWDDRGGFVYVFRNATRGDGALKVGSSFDVGKRLKTLRDRGYRDFADRGDEIEVAFELGCDWFRQAEMKAHELLGMDAAHRLLHGEMLFASEEDAVAAVRKAVAAVDSAGP